MAEFQPHRSTSKLKPEIPLRGKCKIFASAVTKVRRESRAKIIVVVALSAAAAAAAVVYIRKEGAYFCPRVRFIAAREKERSRADDGISLFLNTVYGCFIFLSFCPAVGWERERERECVSERERGVAL